MVNIDPNQAFETVEGEPASALILLCDHASNQLPPQYGSLGLAHAEFTRHIAYDIGSRDLTLGLAARLGATALMTRYSRLLIDPNRGTDDPTLIMKLSDGAVVPGNAEVGAAERRHRIEQFHAPYHRAITAAIDARLAMGVTPLVISIHSFTPYWKGWPRPWHAGILWDRDARIAQPMIAALRRQDGLVIGDNEPYSGALPGDTLSFHATARGLPHVLIEIRQDQIAEKSGVDDWVERLATVIEPFMTGRPEAEMKIDQKTQTELEAATFRRLLEHLRQRTDVQNIDLMNLAGFCRNCLSNWFEEAAKAKGADVSRDDARLMVYGMAYDEWKAKYQREASGEQKSAFAKSHKH